MSTTSRSLRSSISPFRSRKSPAPPPAARVSIARPVTPASSSSTKPPSRHSTSPVSSASTSVPVCDRPDGNKTKENVTVTVRFRPLSPREINKGDEIAWYADGDFTVRNEYNPNIAYGFDRVFGPATTTRHVYDVAAQHVVSGAMQGINGTIFAYGVTSSGKTHTMQTPGREFLLRVSYLEIYNEVINDLLDPTGQNLRIREDAQGTFVEGIKEEVVLSPAHALSLIASGEEHRHVGSNNFNLLSSRSHTIFTLTIESSPCGENQGEDVTLSQLNLIDLAGSESSKTETTGLRRKEGSYINKSLLTLGTVISKLTDGKATHIPYRDSKLTRLLQSSLSGHGRVSLICTVTPTSSNTEETHNTLKFAHRSKHVEIKAAQNKIMDDKSLIKKYQREISCLKQELEQLKRGMMENPYMMVSNQEDLVNLKRQLEAGQVQLQSRLEEEEQAKAALMGRIQRLTKLILVSTKNAVPSAVPEKAGHRRRHSFGEDELAYLPERKREYIIDDDTGSHDSEISSDRRSDGMNLDELVKDYKNNRRRGMLGWFKLKKPEGVVGLSPGGESGSSASGSPASCSKSSQNRVIFNDIKDGRRKSVSRRGDDPLITKSLPERTQAGDLFSATYGGCHLPPTGTTIIDQMDLLREQLKMLAGEVAFCTSSLKRVSEQAASNPEDSKLREQMQRLKDEMKDKKRQMQVLEQRMVGSVEMTQQTSNTAEISQAFSKLASQLNEKTFELEIKSADNRILQEQLQAKVSENAGMQETILLLLHQLDSLLSEKSSTCPNQPADTGVTRHKIYSESLNNRYEGQDGLHANGETCFDESTPTSVMSLNRIFFQDECKDFNSETLQSQLLKQATEIETLKQENVKITEEKDGLEIHSKKLNEEASYAKELAAAAAVELQNLAEEVTKLTYQNAKLSADLAAAKEFCSRSDCCCRSASFNVKQSNSNGAQYDACSRKPEDKDNILVELQQELNTAYQREASLVMALSEREKIGEELQKKLNEAKRREEDLENELANMWVLVTKMRKSGIISENNSSIVDHAFNFSNVVVENGYPPSNGHLDKTYEEDKISINMGEKNTFEELKANYQRERRRRKELECFVARLKGDNISGLDMDTLGELQNLHVEAMTKICHAKFSSHDL
ncbi:Plus-end-directed kinesin ATPase [Bertholletia excelsa]